MDINRANLDALFTGFQAALKEGLGMANLPLDRIAMTANSTTAIEKYPFLLLLSTMREWIGPRQIQNIEGKILQVENKPFEHTIGVPRRDIENDQLGIYKPLFMMMGQDAGNLWPRLCKDALVANAKWLDGDPFFGTTRKFGANTISNLTTDALSATSYAAARLAVIS